MRDFDFRLAGTSAFVLEAQGTRFFYKTGAEASGKIGVIVSAERGGLQLLLLPGEGVRLPAAAGRWMLTKADPTAADITGRLIVGDADFTASRVQGDVNLLNASALAMPEGQRMIRDQMLSLPVPKVRRYRFGLAIQDTDLTGGRLGAFRFHSGVSNPRTVILRRALLCRTQSTEDSVGRQFAMAVHLVGGGLSGAPQYNAGLSEGNQTPAFAANAAISARINAPLSEAPIGSIEFLSGTVLAVRPTLTVEAIQQPVLMHPGGNVAVSIGVPGMNTNEIASAFFEWEEWESWPTT